MTYLIVEQARIKFPTARIDDGTQIDSGVQIASYARIGRDVVIGSNVVIGSYVIIGDCVQIDSNVHIGRGAIIGPDAVICSGATIGRGAIICAGDTYICTWPTCEGYAKTLVSRGGVAFVNAGCRSFDLATARKHWAHRADRVITRALMEEAAATATALGLKLSEHS